MDSIMDWITMAYDRGYVVSNGTVCFVTPAPKNSQGIWGGLSRGFKEHEGKGRWLTLYNSVTKYYMPYLEVMIILSFCLWQFIHFFLKRIGFLNFTSQMIAGALLSPYVTGKNSPIKVLLRPQDERRTIVGTMGLFGYMISLFLLGVKMDMGIIRTTGKKAILIGFAVVLAPTLVNASIYKGKWFMKEIREIPTTRGETTLLLAMNWQTTSAVVSTLLSELRIQNSELGRLASSAAVFSELFSVTANVMATMGHEILLIPKIAWLHACSIVIFFVFALFIFRPAVVWLIKKTPEGQNVRGSYFYFLMLVVFGSGIYMDKTGQFAGLGPFILGLLIPSGAPLGSALVTKFDAFNSCIFLPLFVINCMLKFGLFPFDGSKFGRKDTLNVFICSFVSKFLATAVIAWFAKMPFRDSIALAFIMSKRGITELAGYNYTHEKSTLSGGTFSMGVVQILISSAIVPLAVKYLYDPSKKYAGYKTRNVLNLKPDSELRILPCIHKPENITSMINLLEAMSTTTEYTLGVYALHLVELVGRTQPVFISHKLQETTTGKRAYSQNVINSFSLLPKHCLGIVNINTFTSISSPEYMHEDICMVALDNLTSLIVLPFHRKWSLEGSIIATDNTMIRNLNCSVLELAPCSIGIYVDRSRIGSRTVRKAREQQQYTYRVCMIFIGGSDDREALSLAKRMAKDSRIELSVVRFVPVEKSEMPNWEEMLDITQLKDVKQNNVSEGFVIYSEEGVKDGTETATLLRSMVDDYELFIVGRSNGTKSPLLYGLEGWCDFKELGIIGDMLAAPDLDSKASILVVQQQQQA